MNVASAGVRASASDKGKLLGRLPIGSRVQVIKLQKDFAQVTIAVADFKAKKGYIQRDLLSNQQPTVDAFLAEAEEAAAKGPDYEATILWRALNLDPTHEAALTRILGAAFRAHRYDLAVDATELAIRGARWPALPSAELRTPQALRLQLLRSAIARDSLPILEVLPVTPKYINVTNYDTIQITEGQMYAHALDRPKHPIYAALIAVLISGPTRSDGKWLLAEGEHSMTLEVTESGAWRVTQLQLPGYFHPQQCGTAEKQCEGAEGE
ncbi:MAG: SH3 domain-containing protein [Deltaproteobacteria bacterium]|nr:SH3 domain-containing protein [Deltaproteobacteria bacterium]